MTTLDNQIEWTRINNDANGNPRYVCHFLEFKPLQATNEPYKRFEYNEALSSAKTLGGRKFHNKQYGGGVMFQSYNIYNDTESILIQTGRAVVCSRKPTTKEINFGHGATHYRTFLRSDLLNSKGQLKKWFKADDDKLNYSTK